ncbi:MAG: hypothetical protein N2746_01925 [Deltaproteobacteria bacterium]|nr:hypothetical protein [Deltaproteobacteria bacterium]
MTIILTISSSIILLSAICYVIISLIDALRSSAESSRELFEAEAEKLLLSNIKVPVSIIIPPIQRYEILKKILNAALNVNHPMFQVIITLKKDCPYINKLISDYSLVKLNAVYRMVIKSTSINSSYRSTTNPKLNVILTDSNDTAMSINAAVDVSLYPFICLISEEYIPSKDLLVTLEPPVIENSVPNFGSISSSTSYEGTKTYQYYIKSIYSYSNLLYLSIPTDFAILLKKKFILDKKGMRRGESIPDFIRRMIKEGLKLKSLPETGLSVERVGIFLSFLINHLKKIIIGRRLSRFAVAVNNIYYLSFILVNIVLFLHIFAYKDYSIQILIPLTLIFAIIPLKDIIILLNESFISNKAENPHIIRAIFLSFLKQLGIEQIIALSFIIISIKKLFWRGDI